MNELRKKAVIMSGTTSAVGRALAPLFVRDGFVMGMMMFRDDAAREAIERECRKTDPSVFMLWHRGAVEDPAAMERFVSRVESRADGIDVFVHLAGVSVNRPLARLTDDDYDRIMGANLDGAFALSRALLPRMVRRGSGHLVFVSSFQALRGNPGASLYAASKAGLIGLCKSIASEYGAKNIRCNAILPGFLDSKMTRDLPRSARLRAIRENCLKRANDPLEVARFIHFLTGTRNISGQVFNLDSRILSR